MPTISYAAEANAPSTSSEFARLLPQLLSTNATETGIAHVALASRGVTLLPRLIEEMNQP
jgi:hypothetical protein